MPLIEVPIPNLLGGVSQQPAAQRQPGQLEACDNAILHVVNGLGKRKGSRHLGQLLIGRESVIGTHFINRDAAERYLVLMGERRIRVFSAEDGAEYTVKVNGTTTNAGRGAASAGAPINYLDPRTPDGIVDQDEDFVIGAGDWLSVVGNSITIPIPGRGPFNFGRRESTTAVTADSVAEVGNSAAAAVSDIYQAFGTFAADNLAVLHVKKSVSAINDIELTLTDATFTDIAGARFDISAGGVVTVGAIIGNAGYATAEVLAEDDGWYRIAIRVPGRASPAVGEFLIGEARRYRIRFHTNAATPATKRALLFGARLYDGVRSSQAVPDYVHTRPDLFRALTVSDSTFILNTEQTPAMTAAASAATSNLGFVWVRQGGINDVLYTVTVRYLVAGVPTTTPFSTTSAAAGLTGLRSDSDIAEALRAAIDANANLVAMRTGSVVAFITNTENATNRITAVEVSDSRGDTSMVGWVNTIDKFTNLPLIGLDSSPEGGLVVKVTGDPEREADDYYVKFLADVHDTPVALRKGKWEETVGFGVLTTIDAATMPHRLTRLQDDAAGTVTGVPNSIYFDLSSVDWDDRLVGDDESNPVPSFIGEPIQDLFLYRGRLGFLALDNVILSEAGEVFNFWRSTVLDLVDTDPIDVSAGTRDVAEFRNAATTADSLVLLSDRHEFQLLGDPVLTPASAQLAPVRAFETLPQVRPVDTGRGVIFARHDGQFTSLMELSLLQDDVTFRVDDLTAQAPRYLAGRGLQLAHSSLVGLTAALVDSDPTHVFMHQSFRDDQENRLQSAPFRWTLAPNTLVRGIGFLVAELRLVVERDEGWFLESIATDTEATEGGRPITHLDRRATEDQCTVAYDGGADTTTITLPYTVDPDATMVVVDAESGLIVPITGSSSTTLEVHGDLSGTGLFVGESFTMDATLTEPVIQANSPRGGLIPLTGRPLDVHRLYLYVADTAFLKVIVQPDLRTASSEEFSAAGLGTGLLLEGVLQTYTGDADFAILGQSTELTVTVRNDTPFPSSIQSGRWEILTRSRTQLA